MSLPFTDVKSVEEVRLEIDNIRKIQTDDKDYVESLCDKIIESLDGMSPDELVSPSTINEYRWGDLEIVRRYNLYDKVDLPAPWMDLETALDFWKSQGRSQSSGEEIAKDSSPGTSSSDQTQHASSDGRDDADCGRSLTDSRPDITGVRGVGETTQDRSV